MFKALFELFVLYLGYKLIFEFIIPIYQTSKQVKQKVGEMQRTMNEHMKQQQNAQASANASGPAPQSKKNEDYIDFEEVK
jgi:sortase (surface protein transpeptidase)